MHEPDTRAFLPAMRRKLVKERELINKQIRACDTLLGGTPGGAEWKASAEGDAAPESSARPVPGTTAAAVVEGPGPSVPPSPPRLSEKDRMKLLILAGGKGRGAIQARVELIVEEGPETFCIRDVLAKYIERHGTDRYRLTESISSALWKLARKRGYRVVRPGAGTLPTLYSREPIAKADGHAIRSP